MSGPDRLRDVLSSLDEAARASLLRRNPHLVEAYQREVARAHQVDARVTLEASGAIVVALDGMKLASELNVRETWQARSARAKRQQRAVLGALANVTRELRALWSRFGMTPADRARVKTEKPEEKSKLSRFIGGA